jgi:hypothetical protein
MELGCCLSEFDTPNIMDIKMGVRTFLTSESRKGKPRSVINRISSASVCFTEFGKGMSFSVKK